MHRPKLAILHQKFTIHQLPANAKIPGEIFNSTYYWLARTTDELSIVCNDSITIPGSRKDTGWSCLRIVGILDLSMTGVISGISSILAESSVSIFALSTYQTDYFLVKTQQLTEVISALKRAGYTVD